MRKTFQGKILLAFIHDTQKKKEKKSKLTNEQEEEVQMSERKGEKI